MLGREGESNIMSDSAGPSETGKCQNKAVQVEGLPSAASIFYNSDRV